MKYSELTNSSMRSFGERSDAHADSSGMDRIHDSIYLYRRANNRTWNNIPAVHGWSTSRINFGIRRKGLSDIARQSVGIWTAGGGYDYECKGVRLSGVAPKYHNEKL